MKVLVTGATGFIGRHLITRLSAGHEVYAATRSGRFTDHGKAVRVVPLDLSRRLIADELPQPMDAIVHLAIAKVPFPEAATEMFAVNTDATLRLLDYGRTAGVKQFILASSGDVYGQRMGYCTESDVAAPVSFYAITKYSAEMLALSYREYLTPCVLRLFRPYGPGQVNRLIPNLAERIRQGLPIQVPAGDAGRQTPIHVSDVVEVIERALQGGVAGVFNVAGDDVVSIRGLTQAIGREVGLLPILREHSTDGSDMMGANTSMKQLFGSWSLVNLAEGLARTLNVSGCDAA